MSIRSPYLLRAGIARAVFWAVLLPLINGWVDYANHSLRNQSSTQCYNPVISDDFDTFYEWIAEVFLGIENAIPEQEGDQDNAGKILDLKIYACAKQIGVTLAIVLENRNPDFFFILQPWDNPPGCIWAPPPNV